MISGPRPSLRSATAESRYWTAPGFGLVHCEQIVADRAVVGDGRLGVAGGVVAVVAAEAPRKAHVPDVIRMRSPGSPSSRGTDCA